VRIFVTGTGTDVGKTHVSACLLRAGRRAGRSLAASKAVATGVVEDRCADAELHAEALGAALVPPALAFAAPVSPHLAARAEGRAIDLDVVVARVAELERRADTVLVEGAGGLFSPLDERTTQADLARALRADRLVLVAPDRLGVLHDVRATLLAARSLGIADPIVVLSAPLRPDASTGTNASELEALGITRAVAVFPRAPFDAAESLLAADLVWEALSLRR
jgi:dethiobiotin synthetase